MDVAVCNGSAPVSILIVDDNEHQLLALESILRGPELEIVAVTSGRQALRELLRRSFALVLLDVNLPGMDGFEIAALMRQRRECQSTPIIFMTAYNDDVFVERGYSLGAVDFMLTPIVPEVLRTKVSVFIELHRRVQQVRQQAERLQQRASQLAALARQLTIAEEQERRRVARLLHDDIQQLLAAGMMVARNLEQGHPELAPAVAQLTEILQESLEASRSLAREVSPPTLRHSGLLRALEEVRDKFCRQYGLECALDAPDVFPRLNDALEAFVYQAIGELLLNVLKHARGTRARMTLGAAEGEVTITVEDDGVGFDTAAVPEERNGHHFGLPSILQRLELFEGSLEIGPASSGGASVSMRLPLIGANLRQDAGDGGTVLDPAPSREPGRTARRRLRLVIADDHEIVRRGLRSMLAVEAGIEVVGEACNGSEAVDLVRDLAPDVVLMDLFMPEQDGLAATRAITAAGVPTHVVAMSTSDDESVISLVLEAGAVGFLSKTCSTEQLVSALRTAAGD